MNLKSFVLVSLLTCASTLEGSLSGTGQVDGVPIGVAVTFDAEPPSSSTLEISTSSSCQIVPPLAGPTTSYLAPPGPTQASTQSTITVDVGSFRSADSTVVEFRPSQINALPGTLVIFNMLATGHSVTQSSFDYPCEGSGGFDTGLINNAVNVTGAHLEPYRVESASPTWFFCRQVGHCQRGMVFAINPESIDQMVEFVSRAIHSNSTSPTSGTAVSTLLGTSVSGDCVQPATTKPAVASTAPFVTGSSPISTGHGPSGTGSTGQIPYPTGVGWNSSGTCSLREPYSPSRSPISSSSSIISPVINTHTPVLSRGSALDRDMIWFLASALVIITMVESCN